MTGYFKIRRVMGEYYWVLFSAKGHELCRSAKGYTREQTAQRAIPTIKAAAAVAELVKL